MSIKNTLIVLLTAACAYLLLHALGAFDFGSIIDREHRSHHAALRAKAVNAAPAYILGAVYDDRDWADVETMRGVSLAVDMVNRHRPQKPFVIRSGGEAYTRIAHNAAIQRLADGPDTAVIIGPFESVHIPSTRALTQFHSLPLISPVTVVSERLPTLDPDNFVTLFPPLPDWIQAVLDYMNGKGVTRLLIISPGPGTYGDIFCTELERSSRGRTGFDEVFRLNYQEPLRRRDIERLLRSHAANGQWDALFFGGSFEDFSEFASLLSEIGINLPVYGTDTLHSPDFAALPGAYARYLPKLAWVKEDPDFETLWRESYASAPGYHARLGAETVFLLADILDNESRYDPLRLVEVFRQRLLERRNRPESAVRIVIDQISGKVGNSLRQD